MVLLWNHFVRYAGVLAIDRYWELHQAVHCYNRQAEESKRSIAGIG